MKALEQIRKETEERLWKQTKEDTLIGEVTQEIIDVQLRCIEGVWELRKEDHNGGHPFMYSFDEKGNYWLEYPDGTIDYCSRFDESYKPIVIRTLTKEEVEEFLRESWGDRYEHLTWSS